MGEIGHKDSRLVQMLRNEQRKRNLSQRDVSRLMGWSQQTYNTWLAGVLPREIQYPRIAEYLNISDEMLRELVAEAEVSIGSKKIPGIRGLESDPVIGKITDSSTGTYFFGTGWVPDRRYKIVVDTAVMEPSLIQGTAAWVDPKRFPAIGNEVFAITTEGDAVLGTLLSIGNRSVELKQSNPERKLTVAGIKYVQVVVLAERVAE